MTNTKIYEEKQCPYCRVYLKNINAKAYSNHVRWCPENKTNADKGASKIQAKAITRLNNRLGEFKDFSVKCFKCGKDFIVTERSKQFPIKEKYFCSRACANSRVFTKETEQKRSQSNRTSTKKIWKDPYYINKQLNKRKLFTSKGETEIRNCFIADYPNDGWTFGKFAEYKETSLICDLYSKKLKVVIEYDGIWHFKDIHGQLADKQYKDSLLKEFCAINGYKLIRVKEDIYKKDKSGILRQLQATAYNAEGSKYVEFY